MTTPFYLKSPCDNCPFTLGTEASSSETTARLAEMCVEYDIPFMCHKSVVSVPIGEIQGHTVREAYPTKVCAGWIAARSNPPAPHDSL